MVMSAAEYHCLPHGRRFTAGERAVLDELLGVRPGLPAAEVARLATGRTGREITRGAVNSYASRRGLVKRKGAGVRLPCARRHAGVDPTEDEIREMAGAIRAERMGSLSVPDARSH
jgi:hypothetical protein